LLLGDNRVAVDTLLQDARATNQRPRDVSLKNKVPVLILYHTAWPDAAGDIRFYRDIYNRIKY